MINPEIFSPSREVEDALNSGRAVVALESTVVAHGLPRPQNLETALRLERIVRDAGAVPATVAVIRGTVRVGLDRAALEHVANHRPIHKLSTRDLPVAVARRLDGATTVATTAFLA
ncbi:MAG TPA: pseudouridine-5'-phosphate glycosidase, partial [Pyrinomonadaceae bacterium]